MQVLGYKRIVMMGLSGGGWTTTLAAALDPRIDLSIPIAGSIPCNFGHTSIDFEQFCERPYNQVCDYECQYVLRSSLCRKVFLESAPALIPTTFLGADTCSPVWRGSATRCRSSTSSTRAVSTATAGTRRSRSTIGGCNRRSRGTLKRVRPWDTSTRWGKRPPFYIMLLQSSGCDITTHGDFPRQAGPDARTLAHPSGRHPPKGVFSAFR
jgi:hypothetical protein